MQQQQFVRLSIIQKRLGISRRVVYNWAASGRLPGVIRLNGTWLADVEMVERWIEAGAIKSQELPDAPAPSSVAPKSKPPKLQPRYHDYQPTSPDGIALLRALERRRIEKEKK